MRKITEIIIHCSFTKSTQDFRAVDIRKWHIQDNGWSDIGYNDVICRDGLIESGRPHEIPGAHAKNHNSNSIGICLVGGMDKEGKPIFNFTQAQMLALIAYVNGLKKKYPKAKVIGHNQVSTKDCPCFNVEAFFS